MERGRDSKELVRAAEVAPLVPSDPRGSGGGPAGVEDLRRSRLLSDPLRRALEEAARAHGFDCLGIARPDAIHLGKERLDALIGQGGHGDMDWLAANSQRRSDPRALWPEVGSIIMLGVNY